jgi:hypothetical protein
MYALTICMLSHDRLDFFAVITNKMVESSEIRPYNLVDNYQRFGGGGN